MGEWRKKLKKLFVVVLSVMLVSNTVNWSALKVMAQTSQMQDELWGSDAVDATSEGEGTVSAGDSFNSYSDELSGSYVPEVEWPENEELFAGYVDKTFYGGYSFFARSARDQLPSDAAKALYDALKAEILKVAEGSLASTIFNDSSISEAVFTYMDTNLDEAWENANAEMRLVLDALLHDCPYELYWYDKTTGIMYSGSRMVDGTTVSCRFSNVHFYVAGNYQANGDNTTVNTTITSATTGTVASAQAIVEANKDKTDYEKLIAYKEAICELVTYNHDAADTGDFAENDDPWQMIYVFDGDTSTNVVCEGYAKAFKYLCDMSAFEGNIECYTVSGYMGTGAHMWNIVTMEDGKNYMVDVTNSDSGSVGQTGGLFLAGGTGSVANGFKFLGYTYKYYPDMLILWGDDTDSILNLSATDYEPPKLKIPDALMVGDVTVISNGVLGPVTHGEGWNYDSATNTLTLSGVITGTDDGIYVAGDLTIHVTGDTIVEGTNGCGINAVSYYDGENGTLKISIEDDVNLTVFTGAANVWDGIYSFEDLEISGGTVTATGYSGVISFGDLSISNVIVNATGINYGIASPGNFTVENSMINAVVTYDGGIGIAGVPVATDSILNDNDLYMTVIGDVTLKNSVTLLPGSMLILEDGATLTIPAGVVLDITKADEVSLGTGSSVSVQEDGNLLCGHNDIENNICQICGYGFEATVTTTSDVNYYETFVEAIEQAADGAIVTLLKDVAIAEGTLSDNSLSINQNIVINLDDNTLDLKKNQIINNLYTLEIKDGSIKSTNHLSAITNLSELLLENVNVTCTGFYGIYAPNGYTRIVSGSVEGNTSACLFTSELEICGSPQLEGGVASLEVDTELSKLVVSEELDANTTYTLLVNDSGAAHDLISGAAGVTLEEAWFSDVESRFAVVLDNTANTISLLYDMEHASVKVESAETEYNGAVQTPNVSVTYENRALVQDTDYVVSYYMNDTSVENPIEAGTYTVIITGKGDYFGTIEQEFTIGKLNINDVNVYVEEPIAYNTPQKSIVVPDGNFYTGTISWSPAVTNNKFGFNTAYTATVVLTATGNYKFTENTVYNAGTTQYDSAVVGTDVNGNSTLTMTKTFDATDKEKVVIGIPAGYIFDTYYATAEEAIASLSSTISYEAQTGTTGTFDVIWGVVGTYDATPEATNTFAWVIDDEDALKYDLGNMTEGTIICQNASGIAVINTGKNAEITYDGTTYDVRELFVIDSNAGTPTYSVVTSNSTDAGSGTLNGTALTITKAGKITIKLTTAANGAYLASETNAVLTVNKATGTGSVLVEDITYGDTPATVIHSDTNIDYSVLYTGDGYSSVIPPVDAGDYRITVTFAENALYKEVIVTDSFTIQKLIPVITGIKSQDTLYESTLVSEVVLVAESMSVPGTLVLDGVSELVAGTKEYAYKFTPDDTKNYETVTGKVSLKVLENTLVTMEINGSPVKSEYVHGEEFSITGIFVIAVYSDGTRKDVTNAVTYDKQLIAGQTEIVVSYQGKAASISVTVKKCKLDFADVIWQDTNYTYDGTEKSIELTNIPEGVEVTYTGNKGTNASVYNAKAEITLAEGYSADYYEIVNAEFLNEEYPWSILPKEITSNNTVYVLGDTLIYNGKEQTMEVKSVTSDGLEVTYEVIGNKETNAGSFYVLTVNATGNFMGCIDIPWSIAQKNISDAEIKLDGALIYNGTVQTQNVISVMVDGIEMHIADFVLTGNTATNAGEYTLSITAADGSNFTGSATAKWSIAKMDISSVEIHLGNALTYNGEEQILDYTVGNINGLDITYDATGYKATNAGCYELTITANGNFIGTVTKAWDIAPKDIAGAQIVLGNALTYNGTEQSQSINSVTVNGLSLATADYEISGNTAKDAGNYTLTITGKGNYAGTVMKDYTVAKSAAPVVPDIAKFYIYSEGSGDNTVSIDLDAILPDDMGITGYTLTENSADYVLEEAVSSDGILTYKVSNTGNIGDSTTLVVKLTSKNYEDTNIKVVINITDRFITVLKAGSVVTVTGDKTLTYGQKVGDLEFDTTNAVFVADGTDMVVEGTLSWLAPETVYNAGPATLQWKFTPADMINYTECTGTLAIQVNKAVPTVALPTVDAITYHPEKTLADLVLSGTKGSHMIAGNNVDVDGTWSFYDTSIVPIVKNEGYTVVFTPVDTANYDSVTKSVAVEVAKATPSVELAPQVSSIIYGQTLADAVLSDGKAAYAEGSTISVDGSFAWKDGTVVPTVSDSDFTEYEVVFTPSDTDNYNSTNYKMTLTVNKAPKAPNMPVEIMNVAYDIDKVSKITLPQGWTWESEYADTELKVGEAETAVANYTGADAGNYVVEAVTVTITRASAPVQQPAITNAPDGVPFVYGSKSQYGWDVINRAFAEAKSGETVNVDMNGTKKVPAYVQETIKGKDITVVFHMGNNLSWTVNGQSITATTLSELNLGISSGNTTIPVSILNKVTGEKYSMNVTLDHSGIFGLTAILNVFMKTENEGLYANLFYYNPAYGSMQFICADDINELGMAHLPFTHASEYVIVVDDSIMNNIYRSPETGDDMTMNYLWFVVMAVFAVSGGYAVSRKKRR